MRKRQKFVLSALLLTLGIAVSQSAPLEWRYGAIALLSGLTWVLSAWSLREGLMGIEWLTVLLPSTMFTTGVGLFFILLPEAWWWKALIILLFGVGQYALFLTANIYSVAAIRTIALSRAAQAVGFVMTLLTGFLLFNTILSFRMAFWFNLPLTVLVAFLLLLPSLWSVELDKKLTAKVWTFSLIMAVLLGLFGMTASFWPVSLVVSSLFLTTMLYIYLGIAQHHFAERLFRKTIWEYVTVGVVVLTTMLLSSFYS